MTRKMAREPNTTIEDTTTPAPAAPSKISMVLGLLRREEGATLAELVEATGWLPHTTRAVLTGLRKKGHRLDKTKRGDATCYRIAVVA
jgi:DNA-binding IclR family transcriptional regulator